MQTVIVVLIVAAAAVYVVRKFYRGFKQKQNCACGCSCCDITDNCSESAPAPPRDHPADNSRP